MFKTEYDNTIVEEGAQAYAEGRSSYDVPYDQHKYPVDFGLWLEGYFQMKFEEERFDV